MKGEKRVNSWYIFLHELDEICQPGSKNMVWILHLKKGKISLGRKGSRYFV